ncbi:ABC transporter permease subunit [Pantoea sp. YR343]|uniref:ABC transporter permease n=1 Tax=Pantoea sp. YR343 TaxID=1144341 RepID=UPI0002711508|nr:ABC transporter permease subunit [Pantoea sp. YR343]KAJ9431814.1 ABC transporter permease subunit [Pantoea sp. YR343]
MSIFELFSFGEGGWGYLLLSALVTTLALAIVGMCIGAIFGICGALSALSGIGILQVTARIYTTILRGIPDLLIVYLFYFGSSNALTAIGRFFGAQGFIGVPEFAIGVCALGVVSGAYLTEVFRGAIQAIDKGEIEAALAFGMRLPQRIRRIVLPLAARHALSGIGNVWQMVLKETALLSVIGLVELMRQSQIAGGSTHKYFTFYLAAALLYFAISWLSGRGFARAEKHTMRSISRSSGQ